MPVNENTGKYNGFAFALVPEHVQNEILTLNGITLENRISYKSCDFYKKKKNLQKTPKRALVVTNKHPENQDVFSFSKLSTDIKT